jgi:hypothetical protein
MHAWNISGGYKSSIQCDYTLAGRRAHLLLSIAETIDNREPAKPDRHASFRVQPTHPNHRGRDVQAGLPSR